MRQAQPTHRPVDCQETGAFRSGGAGPWSAVAPDLFRFVDSCNVYLLRRGDRAVVVDAGTGAWWPHLADLGVRHVDGIVFTHLDRDQCCALYRDGVAAHLADVRCVVPAAGAELLRPDGWAEFWQRYQSRGCPAGYAAPARPRAPDATIHGDGEVRVGPALFCAVATPGHTRGALSYVVDWHGRQLAFCGDAVTEGAAVPRLYQLEWDHWTPEGALAAWYGLERLGGNRIDWLLPAHGEPLRRGRSVLRTAQRRLLALVRAKTAVAPGARSRWVEGEPLACGARRLSPHLFAVGGNGFVLADDGGGALVVDPTRGDLPALEAFLAETGLRPEVATASHYHIDHTDALDDVRRRWGAQVWLHPHVAEPIVDRDRLDVPWLPPASVTADRLLPASGTFRWRGYRFGIRPFPGQTWWHCAFDTRVDGRHVLFSGDNFQPPTRWNGTGGFCAYNGSRFAGFAASARTVLDLAPDLICNGHRCIYEYDADHYRRIPGWCDAAEKAVRDLCPAGDDWLADYDPRACRWEPFVHAARRGDRLEAAFVYANHRGEALTVTVTPVPRPGFSWTPARRRLTVPPGGSRRAGFTVVVDAAAGRHVLAADVAEPAGLHAEAAVTLVDVA